MDRKRKENIEGEARRERERGEHQRPGAYARRQGELELTTRLQRKREPTAEDGRETTTSTTSTTTQKRENKSKKQSNRTNGGGGRRGEATDGERRRSSLWTTVHYRHLFLLYRLATIFVFCR